MQKFQMPFNKYDNKAFYQRTTRKFTDSNIAIIGCGGSGSWIALAFAIAGCRVITLIDDDIVEAHTLNRTPYRWTDIGKNKAVALSELIMERRTDVKVYTTLTKIGAEFNWLSLNEENIIIDCTDSFEFQMHFTNAKKEMKIGDKPYLKIGYDGSMYDIDGTCEYIFDTAGNQGYSIISTTVETTMMLASKVVQITERILNYEVDSRTVRVLGDIGVELGITESSLDSIEFPITSIMTNNRRQIADTERGTTVVDDGDFEFEVFDRVEELPEPEVSVSEADARAQEFRDAEN